MIWGTGNLVLLVSSEKRPLPYLRDRGTFIPVFPARYGSFTFAASREVGRGIESWGLSRCWWRKGRNQVHRVRHHACSWQNDPSLSEGADHVVERGEPESGAVSKVDVKQGVSRRVRTDDDILLDVAGAGVEVGRDRRRRHSGPLPTRMSRRAGADTDAILGRRRHGCRGGPGPTPTPFWAAVTSRSVGHIKEHQPHLIQSLLLH